MNNKNRIYCVLKIVKALEQRERERKTYSCTCINILVQ